MPTYYNRISSTFIDAQTNLTHEQLTSLNFYIYVEKSSPEYNKYTEQLYFGDIVFNSVYCWQEITVQPAPAREIPTRTEWLRIDKLTEIRVKADEINRQLKEKYSIWEVDSWTEQEIHSKLILDSKPIPEDSILYTILSGKNAGLSTEQQITIQQLAEKVLSNASQARTAASVVLYQQNALEEAVKTAPSIAKLEAITIEYKLS